VGQAQEGAVGHVIKLVPDGPVQLRAAVAVDIAPQGGDAVQIAVAVNIVEVNALAMGDDQEFFFPEASHLGEGMPEVVMVPAGQGVAIVHDGSLWGDLGLRVMNI
jgi:hypothetical protein